MTLSSYLALSNRPQVIKRGPAWSILPYIAALGKVVFEKSLTRLTWNTAAAVLTRHDDLVPRLSLIRPGENAGPIRGLAACVALQPSRISTNSTPIAGMTTRIGVDFRISASCPRPCAGEDRG